MKILFQYLLLLVFFTSCTSAPIYVDSPRSDWTQQFVSGDRSPSARGAPRVTGTPKSSIERQLQKDPSLSALAGRVEFGTGEVRPLVGMSGEMFNFRSDVLPYLKDASSREAMVRTYEGILRMESKVLEKQLVDARLDSKMLEYDAVIVGGGVHGILALHKALSINPDAKILVVEQSLTPASNFRSSQIFNINSSNRASGEGTKPFPGEGNINELPGAPIQLSDISAVKYPSANDLGQVLSIALYAATDRYPNVDVLLGARADQIETKPSASDRRGRALDPLTENVEIVFPTGARNLAIVKSAIVYISTGPGTPALPRQIANRIGQRPELVQYTPGKNLPRVSTFEDFARLLAESNDPVSLIAGKNIAIVGKGDSANVTLEFLLGYAPAEAYGLSSAQSGRVKSVKWLGQDQGSCDAILESFRSRYAQLATGFRSSSPDVAPLVTADARKVADINGGTERGSSGQVDLVFEDGRTTGGYDLVVFATGYKQQTSVILGGKRRFGIEYTSEKEFLDDNTLSITASIPGERDAKVARQIKDSNIFYIGTAAGELAPKSALKGIIQNFVSIFNNAPRVVKAIEETFPPEPLAQIAPTSAKIKLESQSAARQSDATSSFRILNIRETRFVGAQSALLLKSTLAEALKRVEFPDGFQLASFEIGQMRNETDLNVVATVTKRGVSSALNLNPFSIELLPLIELLASSGDFFSLARELLKAKGGVIRFEPTTSGEGLTSQMNYELNISDTPFSLRTLSKPVQNASFPLRGIDN